MTDERKRDGTAAIVKVAESAAIELTAATIKRYVNPYANDQEIALFLNQCVMFGLNPFKREIYLIKYGSNEPATFVVGYESYLKRADRTGGWGGMESGTVDGPDGRPVSAWVKVFRKDWAHPLIHEVYFNEYCQYKDEVVWENGAKKKTGRKVPTKFWAEKPRTMLKKVAIAQAIRMAFPDEMGGMPYTAEEMPVEHDRLPTAEIVTGSPKTGDRPVPAPLPRIRDEFDPEAPVAPKTATPAPAPCPPAAAPAEPAKPAPAAEPEPARRKPGRPAKPKPAPVPAATSDPDDPNYRAPFDDDEPESGATAAASAAPAEPGGYDNPNPNAADPAKIAELKSSIEKLRQLGVSDEKIYIGINRSLVNNRQMVIAELGDLDNIGVGIAIAYVNSWRHKIIDDRAKADAAKGGK